ncbi:hypothetical protein [Mesorhizobium sp. SARCC-RB16n]|nr:hypothetical protein [Mesorhizobium sp. SARCC-RB16n]
MIKSILSHTWPLVALVVMFGSVAAFDGGAAGQMLRALVAAVLA